MNANRNGLVVLGMLAAACASPGIGLAAKCSGYNVNHMISWEPIELSKGETLTTFKHSSIFVSDDPNSTYHLAAGECGGTLITAADGTIQGGGNCSRKDKDGDIYHEQWTFPAGKEFKGTWKLVGGTGKYSNATGAGSWEVVMSQGKMAAVKWLGTCR
jgi:hypothetical protein